MLKRYWLSAVLTFALVLSASCSTLNVGNSSPEREVDAFTLNVLEDSYFNGSSVEGYFLTTEETDTDVMVSVNAYGAADLKALYFEMEYDADQLRPMGVHYSEGIADDADRLSLTYLKDRGSVTSGQMVANPDWHSGFSGDGVLAVVNFRKAGTPLIRETSKVNTSPAGGALEITFDGTDLLEWWYNNPADYDQNGEVGISDLTPLGINLNKDASGATFMDSLSVVDGDKNGLITLADITPIGVNFGNSCNGGYNVYAGNSADKPSGGDPDVISELDTVAFSAATGTNVQRKKFSYTVASPNAADEYWVRGVSAASELGTPSDTVGGDPNAKPGIELLNPTPDGGGTGTGADPFVITSLAQATGDFTFEVTASPNDGGGVITGDSGVEILTNPAGANSGIVQGTGVVSFNNTETSFTVSALVNGVATNNLSFSIQIAPAGLFIFTDPADTDWSTVTGDGATTETAYIIATNSFNTDGSTEFSFIANSMNDGSGDVIDVNTLTWGADIPFMVTNGWSTPGTATFEPNFTNTFVFAQDAELNNSNDVHVAAENLPE
ncbi:MAG: hypothetical protein R3F46_04085 [bacterium]